MTIIGACLLAVLLVVAGLTVLGRNRARLQSGAQRQHGTRAEEKRHDDKAQRMRKQRRAQSRHDRRKH